MVLSDTNVFGWYLLKSVVSYHNSKDKQFGRMSEKTCISTNRNYPKNNFQYSKELLFFFVLCIKFFLPTFTYLSALISVFIPITIWHQSDFIVQKKSTHTIFNSTSCPHSNTYLLFCDAPHTCFSPRRPSLGTSFTNTTLTINAVQDVHTLR